MELVVKDDSRSRMTLTAILVGFIVTSPITAYTVLVEGFVVYKVWEWFIQPLSGVALPFGNAAGVMAATALIQSYQKIQKNSDFDIEGALNMTLLTPWLTLLICWLVKVVFL